MPSTISYTAAKAAMAAAGLPTSSGSSWQGIDEGSWQLFAVGASYAQVPYDQYATNYGFAYPVMPDAVASAVAAGAYSATLATTPLTATHGVAVTNFVWTLTETNGPGTQYVWDFGDGSSTTTTASPTTGPTSHTYAAAGTYTAKVTVTAGGKAHLVTAAAPVVVS